MEIFVKLLIGFVVFFVGVVLNVSIMKKFEGRKTEGFMPLFSFILICAGMVMLIVMARTIKLDIAETASGSPEQAIGLGAWR